MKALVHTRCFNHIDREAVARCPECRRDFCRECVTEHKRRFLCAACLNARMARTAKHHRGRGVLVSCLQLAVAICLLWAAFYVAGQALLLLPTEFESPLSAVTGAPE